MQDSEKKVEIECDYFGRIKGPLEFGYHDTAVFHCKDNSGVGEERASEHLAVKKE